MKKRFLAALLSLCMTLTLLPTTAFAAVSDSMGNTPEENQAILEQVSALTGDSSDQVLSMLNALGLLWMKTAISRWIKPSRWTARC